MNPLLYSVKKVIQRKNELVRRLQARPMLTSILPHEYTDPHTADLTLSILYYRAFVRLSDEEERLAREAGLPTREQARQRLNAVRGVLPTALINTYEEHLDAYYVKTP